MYKFKYALIIDILSNRKMIQNIMKAISTITGIYKMINSLNQQLIAYNLIVYNLSIQFVM